MHCRAREQAFDCGNSELGGGQQRQIRLFVTCRAGRPPEEKNGRCPPGRLRDRQLATTFPFPFVPAPFLYRSAAFAVYKTRSCLWSLQIYYAGCPPVNGNSADKVALQACSIPSTHQQGGKNLQHLPANLGCNADQGWFDPADPAKVCPL